MDELTGNRDSNVLEGHFCVQAASLPREDYSYLTVANMKPKEGDLNGKPDFAQRIDGAIAQAGGDVSLQMHDRDTGFVVLRSHDVDRLEAVETALREDFVCKKCVNPEGVRQSYSAFLKEHDLQGENPSPDVR